MDPGTNNPTALADGLEGQRHKATNGGKDDRDIEQFWRHLVRTTRPDSAKALGKGLIVQIARSSEGERRSSLPLQYLRDDMGRGAKSV